MLILIFTAGVCLRFGSVEIPLGEFLPALLNKPGSETFSVIIYSLRLPRLLAGILAGVGLSLSGVLLQAVTNNHLASPNIIGVNAGAGFTVILSMAFFPTAVYLRPFFAFVGAFAATAVILFVSSRVGSQKSTVILSGIAVTTLLNAAISFISYYDNDLLASYNYFSVGTLGGCTLKELIVPTTVIFLSLIFAMVLAQKTDILCLGDSIALSLGVNVKALRLCCLVIAGASAAAVVSFAGLLGFVGLVVPHIARRLVGTALRQLIPVTVLTASIIVLWADLLGRVILAPSEIPVGIVMAFVGAPFLFYLLIRRKKYAEL